MDSSTSDFSATFTNLSVGNEWRTNLPIGSRIKLINNDILYIFYGYNYNKSIIGCFPENAKNINEYIKYVPITEINKQL